MLSKRHKKAKLAANLKNEYEALFVLPSVIPQLA
jgi:hypothetical protein